MDILINADDFGLSDETVEATIECFERGALTSATIMPGMPATARALAYARSHPELAFGAHLTFVRNPLEQPLSTPDAVPSLVNAHGKLLQARVVRRRALLRRLPVSELEHEMEAQFAVLRDAGVPLSHVDSHRHLHKFAPFREALTHLGIRRVRAVQDVWLRRPATSPTYWLGSRWRRRLAERFVTTDHFFMAGVSDEPWNTTLLDKIEDLPGATLEIGVHPGRTDLWRQRDLTAVAAFAAAARERGHRLVSWATFGK
jgi:chitin disaccharide deacetylase